jgi:TetR/AcrR family transcriptional repressor of nem operon
MEIEKLRGGAKAKILDAALMVIRTKGYSATTVDDLCATAGVTKGAFFHHFKTKEDLAIAAAEHFASLADRRFSTAPYRQIADPLDRLLGYIDFRKSILQGELPQYTCLLGTMVQESFETHPLIRKACEKHILDHAKILEVNIAQTMAQYGSEPGWTAWSLALHIQAVIQGAFILAKATHGPEAAASCLDHLHRYIDLLFRSVEQSPLAFYAQKAA